MQGRVGAGEGDGLAVESGHEDGVADVQTEGQLLQLIAMHADQPAPLLLHQLFLNRPGRSHLTTYAMVVIDVVIHVVIHDVTDVRVDAIHIDVIHDAIHVDAVIYCHAHIHIRAHGHSPIYTTASISITKFTPWSVALPMAILQYLVGFDLFDGHSFQPLQLPLLPLPILINAAGPNRCLPHTTHLLLPPPLLLPDSACFQDSL